MQGSTPPHAAGNTVLNKLATEDDALATKPAMEVAERLLK